MTPRLTGRTPATSGPKTKLDSTLKMSAAEPAGNGAGESSAPAPKPAPSKPAASDSDSAESSTPFDAAVIAALMELPTSPPTSPREDTPGRALFLGRMV